MQRILTEKEAEELLEKQGFNVIKRAFAKTKKDIKSLEKKIKLPWAMKASSSRIVHKAKLGGIILNINSIEEAESAFSKLEKIENFQEALVQPMILGEEAIIGIKKTPEFGQVLMFGKGGSRVEQEKDVSFRVLPVKESDVKEMMKETKFIKTLEEKNINLDLIAKTIMKFAVLTKKYPSLIELDINPLIATSKEAVIIDARIVFED